MKRLLPYLVAGSAAFAAAACQEKLASPAECPEFCPGGGLQVQDILIDADVGGDTTYSGYIGYQQMEALLVSNSPDAGQARAFLTFPKRSDSVVVDGSTVFLDVDSIAVTLELVGRDSLMPGLKLFLYRIPPDLDSTTTVSQLDAAMTEANFIDSVIVHDTLRRGTVRAVLLPEKFVRLASLAESDSGRLGMAVRVTANEPTGARFGAVGSTLAGAPNLIRYGRVNVPDTSRVKQTSGTLAERTNYAIDIPPEPLPGRLTIGGKRASRSQIRFTIPRALRDSGVVLRATLELTPVGPIRGVPHDPATMLIRTILADLGPKSPVAVDFAAEGKVVAGETEVVRTEVLSVVTSWFGFGNPRPTTIFLGLSPEAGTFVLPEFETSRSATGRPRLRITYALPTRPGHP
ncbi:MAG: hypothetical protein HOP28_06365 [Gemmatimonadales bacterium]|nr:hypothetical protein [Gemmatimonadales bacterium]